MTPYSLTALAQADLDEIWHYIASDNPSAADRLLERFEQTFFLLGRNPLLGELREELRPNLRRFVMRNYVIYYEPMQDYAMILRVVHGARDVDALF